jgi:hypothetical protein
MSVRAAAVTTLAHVYITARYSVLGIYSYSGRASCEHSVRSIFFEIPRNDQSGQNRHRALHTLSTTPMLVRGSNSRSFSVDPASTMDTQTRRAGPVERVEEHQKQRSMSKGSEKQGSTSPPTAPPSRETTDVISHSEWGDPALTRSFQLTGKQFLPTTPKNG